MTAPTGRSYLDHVATTPLRPPARDAFLAASETLGNPSSTHTSGRAARAVLDDAVESIATDLGVPTGWIVLTSGGTEADDLALRGAARGVRDHDARRDRVVACASDHPAVIETVQGLGEVAQGILAPVDRQGILDVDVLERLLAPGTTSVLSAALVNNETGVRQDVEDLAERAHRHGALLHTDAVQAVGHTTLPDLRELDLVSISGHKLGAPVGIGVLVARPGLALAPVTRGGGQGRGIRSGTLAAPLAAALAAALHATVTTAPEQTAQRAALAARLREGVLAQDPGICATVDPATPSADHIVHVLVPGADAETLLFLLDQAGIDASAGSACTAGVTQDSHVLAAMGVPAAQARGALRLSLGWTTTDEDIARVLEVIGDVVARARAVETGTRVRRARRAGAAA